jgi:hypothetical protein
MADTRVQVEAEDWVRLEWMPKQFRQKFSRERVKLSSGGVFDFDAVSDDRSMAATISTSSAKTATGKYAVGKLMKLRSDMLFLILANVSRRLLILAESDMYDLCQKEKQGGRVPTNIEFLHAALPADLSAKLLVAKAAESSEVSPR